MVTDEGCAYYTADTADFCGLDAGRLGVCAECGLEDMDTVG